MSQVRCIGNESHISQCRHVNLSTSYNGYEEPEARVCSHHEDVGVSCYTPDLKAKNRVGVENSLQIVYNYGFYQLCACGIQ